MDYFSAANPSSSASSSSSSSAASKEIKKQSKVGKRGGNNGVKLSTDPQSVAARERRHRISDRFKILQSLVPGGSKMDTVSMLEEAINYVKFLKTQILLHQTIMNFMDDDSFLINSLNSPPPPPGLLLPPPPPPPPPPAAQTQQQQQPLYLDTNNNYVPAGLMQPSTSSSSSLPLPDSFFQGGDQEEVMYPSYNPFHKY